MSQVKTAYRGTSKSSQMPPKYHLSNKPSFQDQNRFLFKMNNEVKVEARAKRAAKEKTTTGKGKRGAKRKSPTPEPEAQAGSPKIVTDPLVLKDKVARISEDSRSAMEGLSGADSLR